MRRNKRNAPPIPLHPQSNTYTAHRASGGGDRRLCWIWVDSQVDEDLGMGSEDGKQR